MAEPLTNLEYNEWKRHPVTVKILAQLRSKEAFLKQEWVDRKFIDAEENAYQQGFVNGMFECLNVRYVEEID